MRTFLIAVVLLALPPLQVIAMEHVTVQRDGRQFELSGEIVVEAKDGGMMLLTADGALWLLPAAEIQQRRSDGAPLQPLTIDQMGERLLAEMGEGFEILTTDHYVICHNTSRAYAQWCGGLYERLLRALATYWKTRGIELEEPRFPLVALVFDSKEEFQKHAQEEIGDAARSMIGYFNMMTNRVTMYDLTGVGGAPLKRNASYARIQQLLSQPGAERTVATIVHEATHQISYNTGLQTRFADNPFWVSEGLAVYFETPDLRSRTGWRGIGGLNQVNFQQFRLFSVQRPADSLRTLVADDKRFQDAKQVTNAYAEAWALSHFLIRLRKDQYAKYLGNLAKKKPLVELNPQQRLAEFEAVFGDIDKLDEAFMKYMSRLK